MAPIVPVIGVASLWLLVASLIAIKRARRYIAATCTPGYVGPPPSRLARTVSHVAFKCLVYLVVGRVTVAGREHIPDVRRVFIAAANHPHFADGIVLACVLGFPSATRYFVARGALRFAFGLGALALGPPGAVSVDLRPGRATRELKAGVRLLAAGERLVTFPEGWAHMDGRRGAFKRGTIYIAKRAAAVRGEPVPIVPFFLDYPRHADAWLTRRPPWQQYVLTALTPWRHRGGVTVVVGEPMLSTAFTDDFDAAAAELEARVYALAPGAAIAA